MENAEKSLNIDNVKWILTLLIVLYHIQYVGVDEAGEKSFLFVKNLGDCVVPAFSLISGFLFWRWVDSFEKLKEKMKRRVMTLLVPYLLWNFINTLYLKILEDGMYGLLNINIIDNILKWNSSPHFWYIFMLMFWTILAPILYLVYKDKRLLVILLLSQAIYLIYEGEAIYHSRFIYILYTWGGLLGTFKPDLNEKIVQWPRKKKVISASVAMVIYFALGISIVPFEIPMQIKVWIYALRAVLLIIGTINLPFLYIGRKTQYKYAFWLFAVHYWLDSFVSGFVSKYFYGNLYQLMTWIIVFGVGIFMGFIMNKICPQLFKLLTGYR